MSKGRKILYWIVSGIVLSIAMSSMVLTRDGGLFRFYDDGYVKDLKDHWLIGAYAFGQYDGRQQMHYTPGENVPSVYWQRGEDEVHYLQIDIGYWNGIQAEWVVTYQDSTGSIFYEDRYEFTQGKLVIPILNMDYAGIFVALNSEGTIKYQMNCLSLSEYEELLNKSKWIAGCGVCFLVYVVISVLAYAVIQRKLRIHKGQWKHREPVYFLEEQADLILKHLNLKASRESYASKVRIALVILLVVNGRIMHYSYRYGYALFIAIVFLLALTAWIPVGESVNRNRHIVWQVWLIMCGIQFISNLFLKKAFGYGEYIEVWMILCFGLLYRAWGRMEKPQKLLDDLYHAVQILVVMITLYCLFGDAWKSYSNRLTGTRSNTAVFAHVVAICFVFMLFRIYQLMKQKKKWYHYLLPGFLGGASVWMLNSTESRNAFIIASMVAVVFLGFIVNYFLQRLPKKQKIMILVLLLLVFVVGLLFLIKNGVILQSRQFYFFSWNLLLSGRPEIWKEYLEKVNIIGCTENLMFDTSGVTSAHNGIIMMMYRYGVFAGIIKIVFLVEVACTIFRIWKRDTKNEYAFLSIGIFIAYFISAMLDTCDEGMIGWLGWIVFYMVVGYIVQEDRLGLLDHDGR